MAHLVVPLVATLVTILGALGYRFARTIRRTAVPIEIISGDRACRWRWRRVIGNGVRRLQRLTGTPTSPAIALLVVESLPDGQRSALSSVRRRGDGRTFHLVRLALSVPDRRLAPDEVLAALAEQYLAVTVAPKAKLEQAAVPSADAADRVATLLADLGRSGNGAVRGG
jgi:hypothetical protein